MRTISAQLRRRKAQSKFASVSFANTCMTPVLFTVTVEDRRTQGILVDEVRGRPRWEDRVRETEGQKGQKYKAWHLLKGSCGKESEQEDRSGN